MIQHIKNGVDFRLIPAQKFKTNVISVSLIFRFQKAQ